MPAIVCIFTPPHTHHTRFSRRISNISCGKDRGGEDAENVMRQSIALLKSLSRPQDHTITQAYCSLFTPKKNEGGGKRGAKGQEEEKGRGKQGLSVRVQNIYNIQEDTMLE